MILANLNVRFHHNLINKTTSCGVFINETVLGEGVGKCGQHDFFSKRIGRKVAMTKAISGLPRETREIMWTEYKAQTNIV